MHRSGKSFNRKLLPEKIQLQKCRLSAATGSKTLSYILSVKHHNLQSSRCVPFSLVQFGGSVEENCSCGPLLSGSGFCFMARELGPFQKMLPSLTPDFQEGNKVFFLCSIEKFTWSICLNKGFLKNYVYFVMVSVKLRQYSKYILVISDAKVPDKLIQKPQQ